MIEKNNIKDFAIAAFRQYHYTRTTDVVDDETAAVILAVSSTLHHLKCERDTIAIDGIKQVYFKLPQGDLKRGTLSSYVRRAAYDMNVSERVLWYKLRRARRVFNYYHNEFMTKSLQ